MNNNELNHAQTSEMAAAYAIGALEPQEAQAMERHLESCPACVASVAEMREVVDLLPYSVDLVDPPAHVKERLFQRIRQEAPAAEPLRADIRYVEPTQTRRGFWSSLFGSPWPAAISLASLLVVVSMSTVILQQRGEINRLQRGLAEQQAIRTLVAAPNSQMAQMSNGPIQAKMLMTPNSKVAYLVIQGLPALPENRDYQIWLAAGGKPVSAGVFHPNGNGDILISTDRPLSDYAWIGITQEPRGGSPAPTTKPVMGGKLGD